MAGQTGIGVLIQMLGGNADSVEAFKKGVGKKITALRLDKEDESLHFEFEDGYKMRLFDDGQSCCESRYMTCDDDLQSFIGSTLVEAEVREAPDVEEDYEVHEVQFLVVTTSLGQFTCETHNEHNGYYGGFWVIAQELADSEA